MRLLLLSLFFISSLSAEELLSLNRTNHSLAIEGQAPLPYTAITGAIPILDEEGDETTEIFFIAYLKEEEGATERPLTFFFPGGPGGASAATVMCSVGPRRILLPPEGKELLPPYKIIDNPETILPWTDLIFVDPIGSGYSPQPDEEDRSKFFSVEGDLESLAQFIRSFVTYFKRWNAPKYLAGASYGTTRCCGLAEELRYEDISLHGIILLGTALDFSTLIAQYNNPLPHALLIPTFAASAWYHGRLWPEKPLPDVVAYARTFLFERYMPAMFQPSRFTPQEMEAFYKELAHLIGLPFETVYRYQGRLDEHLYTTEFFAAERKILGGLDSRYVGDLSAISRWGGGFEDPSYRDLQGLHCAFNDYLRNELQTTKSFNPYIFFNRGANRNWNFATYDSYALPDLFQRVRRTLIHNNKMKVFVGSGYYDCRTPFAATEYCFDHLQLPPFYKKNFQFEYYEGGHGFIFDIASLKKLKNDLARFYKCEEEKSE